MLSVLFGNNIYQQPQTKLVALNKHPYTTYEWIKKTVDFVSNRCGAQHFVYKRKTCTIYWIGIGHFVGKRTSCTLYSQRDSANLEFNNHKTHTHTQSSLLRCFSGHSNQWKITIFPHYDFACMNICVRKFYSLHFCCRVPVASFSQQCVAQQNVIFSIFRSVNVADLNI